MSAFDPRRAIEALLFASRSALLANGDVAPMAVFLCDGRVRATVVLRPSNGRPDFYRSQAEPCLIAVALGADAIAYVADAFVRTFGLDEPEPDVGPAEDPEARNALIALVVEPETVTQAEQFYALDDYGVPAFDDVVVLTTADEKFQTGGQTVELFGRALAMAQVEAFRAAAGTAEDAARVCSAMGHVVALVK